ncbi:AzlC family ABC transporter permease [Halomonas sp. Y3]|uniref:AzlC family ABC transporter permease n=1 Tax=Halomonas sp. Y3 TaxID=2956797 RepID=UPI00209EDE20|nr:AzlC family ABC transporter permease [Halomonas sp. Y3]
MNAFLRGLAGSASVAAGYLPIAFGFGLTALQAGLSPQSTLLTSMVVFAGASQFILVALLTSGAGLLGTLGAVLLMNARHLLYGPALMPQLMAQGKRYPTPLLAFGLTDEVFATAAGRLDQLAPEDRQAWHLGLQLGAYGAWMAGTLMGVTFGGEIDQLPIALAAALEFILPALFFVLLLEIGVRKWLGTIVVTVLVTALLQTILPSYHALTLGMLLGAASSQLRRKPCSRRST